MCRDGCQCQKLLHLHGHSILRWYGDPMSDPETPDSTRVLRALQDWIESERHDRNLSKTQTRVLRHILFSFARDGKPPSRSALGTHFGLTIPEVDDCLSALHRVDAIYVGPSGSLEGAYPFSALTTPFQVTYHHDGQDRMAYAMCAIDALGIPYMLGTMAHVASLCAHCGEPIHIDLSGGAIDASNGCEAVVFVSLSPCGNAATSLCKDTRFFSSPTHFQVWREQNKVEGAVLSMSEAMYVAKGIFEELLKQIHAEEKSAQHNCAEASAK